MSVLLIFIGVALFFGLLSGSLEGGLYGAWALLRIPLLWVGAFVAFIFDYTNLSIILLIWGAYYLDKKFL